MLFPSLSSPKSHNFGSKPQLEFPGDAIKEDFCLTDPLRVLFIYISDFINFTLVFKHFQTHMAQIFSLKDGIHKCLNLEYPQDKSLKPVFGKYGNINQKPFPTLDQIDRPGGGDLSFIPRLCKAILRFSSKAKFRSCACSLPLRGEIHRK